MSKNNSILIKSTDSEEELVQYFGYNITGRDNMSAIVFDSTMDEITSFLSEYIDENVSIYKKIENNNAEIYLISKITDREGKISLIIEPFEIWDENIDEYVYKNVDDKFIMIEEGTLDEDDIRSNIHSDKIVQVGLKDEEKIEDIEDENNCDECNECCSYNKNNSDKVEDYDEVDEFINFKINEYENSDKSLYILLTEVYQTAFNNGFNFGLLNIQENISNYFEEN